jgi:hypothetical protein
MTRASHRSGLGAKRTLRLGKRQPGVRGHPGGAGPTPWGRSGQGPRTHDGRPVPFETRQPRLEDPALPDPTASTLRAAVEDRQQSPLQARHEPRRPKPSPGCWKCTGATSKVEAVGGRAGLGPRGAGTAHRTTAASLRVFEGPALNGPRGLGLARRDGGGRSAHGPPPKRPQATVCGERLQSAASRQSLLRRSSEAHWSP